MSFYDMSPDQRNSAIRDEIGLVRKSISTILNEPDSVWGSREHTIASMFKRHAKEGALIEAGTRIRLQSGIRERFRWGLEQSTMFQDTIKAILNQYQVPEKLAYLPHVESSFDIFARSKVGALGMWQFMPATARIYLRIDDVVDERLDPILSTEAAAKLLAHNYSILGSWPLAVTAYNHGVRGIQRAINTTGTRNLGEIIRRHSSPSFKFASKNFYSCFIAAAQVASNPQVYFDNLAQLPPYKISTIELHHPLEPSTLSRYLDISHDMLVFYNPAINPELFKPGGKIPKDYSINIPVVNRENNDYELANALSGGILGMEAFFGSQGRYNHRLSASYSPEAVYKVMNGRIEQLSNRSTYSAMVNHRFNVPNSPLPYETARNSSTDNPHYLPVSVYHSGSLSIVDNRL